MALLPALLIILWPTFPHSHALGGDVLANSAPKQSKALTAPANKPQTELAEIFPPDTYTPGNCTYGVSSWVVVPQDLGNANTWASQAAAEGYTVSSTPKVGAVAQTSAGAEGHVALVIAINGSQVEVQEMNYEGLGIVDTRWTNITDWSYIYF